MFNFLSSYMLWVKLAGAAVLLGGSFMAGHHLATLQERSAAFKIEQAQQAAMHQKDNELAQLSSQLEVAKNAQTALTQTLTRKVDRIITRRIYQYACFDDDGLRIANNALTGTNPGESSSTLPSTPTAH